MTQPSGSAPQWWQPPPGQADPHHSPHHTPPAGEQAPGFPGAFPSQYGGFGAFDNVSPAKRRSRAKWWIVGVTVVVVLGGGGAAAWFSGLFQGDVLDQDSLHEGVATVLTEHYGEHDVDDVRCPTDQRIATGHTFDCAVQVAGEPRTVTVRVLNDKPEYEVGAPH